MEKSARIYIAGHRGLVGSAIVRQLEQAGYENLLLRISSELDLRNQAAVDAFFAEEKPEYVFLAAAKVGGIYANDTWPADFIRDNLQIQTNTIDAAYRHGVKRLLFLGSSCIYPKLAPQPMPESCLLTGELEPTNEWYAIAKIAGIKMCQAYHRQYGFDAISAMPTNLYGPNDHFDLEKSHVLPALIRKFHLAKLALAGDVEAIAADEQKYGAIPDDLLASLGLMRTSRSTSPVSRLPSHTSPRVVLWGSGAPYREFLHVDDMAAACLFLMTRDFSTLSATVSQRLFNVGIGEDITIRDLADMVQNIVGFDGDVVWDASKPDGTPRKLMDVSCINRLGWKALISLEEGIRGVYDHYQQSLA
ncbi:MAG: GDP-L-fucose synthase family protein [Mariprofundus sp.]